MRNLLLILSACCIVNTAHAQEVKYSKEIVSKDGAPYARLAKEGSALLRKYSLQNMDGEELAVVKPDNRGTETAFDDRYIIHFL